jgi:hypothetical protein
MPIPAPPIFFPSIICLCTCIAVNATSTKKSGTISTSETWSDTILIAGDVSINAVMVSVSSGATVIFSAGSKINVASDKGVLDFKGTASSPIFIKGGAGKNIGAYGRLFMKFCRIDSCKVSAASGASESPCMIFEDNIVTNGDVTCSWKPGIIRRNFIHDPLANNQIVLSSAINGSIISDNIIFGGSWVTGNLGGKISGNIFIALVVPEGSTIDKNTHEHMYGVRDSAVIERNIYIGQVYGAIMGIGENNAAHVLVRNNTFDLRGSGAAIIFHQTKTPPTGMVVRNNIFMRCLAINDEQSTPNSIMYTDYNLFTSVSTRYKNIIIDGKNIGDEGYDKNGIPSSSSALLPGDVVENPEFGYPFPYSDGDMFNGKVLFDSALARYRNSYSPKKGSAAIDNGAPQDSSDFLVTDKKCDIGAVEYTGKPYNIGPSFVNVFPADGSVRIANDTTVSCDISDPDTVDATMIIVTVNQVDVTSKCKLTDFSNGLGRHLAYKPAPPYSSGIKVTVSIKAGDKKGGVNAYCWSFSTMSSATKSHPAPSPSNGPRIKIVKKSKKGLSFIINHSQGGSFALQVTNILGKKYWEYNGQCGKNAAQKIEWNPTIGLQKGAYVVEFISSGSKLASFILSIT